MASLNKEAHGGYRIQFEGDHGKRQTLRIGKVNKATAEACKTHVEALIVANRTGQPIQPSTDAWLNSLPPSTIDKLATVKLIMPKPRYTLDTLCRKVIHEKVMGLKPASVKKLWQAHGYLLEYFSDDPVVHDITRQNADEWRQWLATRVSIATAKRTVGDVKTLCRYGLDREWIDRNPFAHLTGGTTARAMEDMPYIEASNFHRVLAELPNDDYRCLFALARFAGLRVPSESALLTWADVEWEKMMLTVRSPKTEHHAGKAVRRVPITPDLLPYLLARKGEARPTCKERRGNAGGGIAGNTRRHIDKAADRAGVPRWPGICQSLRSSCERQWVMEGMPEAAAARALGHSTDVARKNYTAILPDQTYNAFKAKLAEDDDVESDVESTNQLPSTAPHPNAKQPLRYEKSPHTLTGVEALYGGGGNRTPVPG